MRLIALGLFVSISLPIAASAQPVTPPAPEAKAAKPEKAKKVCRSTFVTGQRIPRRECKTEAEWASVDGARDGMEALRIKTPTPQGN